MVMSAGGDVKEALAGKVGCASGPDGPPQIPPIQTFDGTPSTHRLPTRGADPSPISTPKFQGSAPSMAVNDHDGPGEILESTAGSLPPLPGRLNDGLSIEAIEELHEAWAILILFPDRGQQRRPFARAAECLINRTELLQITGGDLVGG